MARHRGSEQFKWDDRSVKRLRCYVRDAMAKRDMARLLGTSPKVVGDKLQELGLEVVKVKWGRGPKPSTNAAKWDGIEEWRS